jgi:hypothetical protein
MSTSFLIDDSADLPGWPIHEMICNGEEIVIQSLRPLAEGLHGIEIFSFWRRVAPLVQDYPLRQFK